MIELEDDLRYLRVGYIDQGRFIDELVQYARKYVPGEALSIRFWIYRGAEDFVERFGGGVRWATTQNYHLLYFFGVRILRIWTAEGTAENTWVDVSDSLANLLPNVVPIPKGSLTKCRPFKHRVRVTDGEDLKQILQKAKEIHGIHSS